MNFAKVLICASILMFLIPVSAWDWDTHRFLAEKICDHYSCKCHAEIKEGSIIPDRDFRDFSNHSCYDPSKCSPSSYWSCPYKRSCPAIDKAREWMEKAAKARECERWKYVGIASHYFFDSKCFWHQVTNEDYSNCHKPFEDEVGDKVISSGLSDWTVCKCGACVSSRDFESWLQEFYAFADGYLPKTNPTAIGSCGDIIQPGSYYLAKNISGLASSKTYCIGIFASNVVLEGKGLSITGPGDYGTGIYISVSGNVSVKDLTVSKYEKGVSISLSHNVIAENINLEENSYSLELSLSNNNTIKDSTIRGKAVGISFFSSNNNTITNVSVRNCSSYGLSLSFSDRNTITNSSISYNGVGIYLSYSGNNVIYNNYFNNTKNISVLDFLARGNLWSIPKTPGKNIVGGNYLGGNYWGSPDGKGFSDTCADGDRDGICDTPFWINSYNVDDLPLAPIRATLYVTNATIPVGGKGTVKIVLDSAATGVSGYNITFSIPGVRICWLNGSCEYWSNARIAGVKFPEWAKLNSTRWLTENYEVELKAVDINDAVKPGYRDVVLAEIEIEGVKDGSAKACAYGRIDDDSGNPLVFKTECGNINVTGCPKPVAGAIPRDINSDGLYEDINGNGRLDFDDVVKFFNYLEDPSIQKCWKLYDFNGNGRLDFDDVVKLFRLM